MSELSRRKRKQEQNGRTLACYCDSCERVLYVVVSRTLYCPVCSSTVTLGEPSDVTIEIPVEESSRRR